jgi:hypothetical protein
VRHARLDTAPAEPEDDADITIGWRVWLPAILFTQLVVVEYLVGGSWRGAYSYRENFISQLGVRYCADGSCNTSYPLLNASLLLVGVGLAVLAHTLWRGAQTRGAAVLFAWAAIGTVVAGVCPEDRIWAIHSAGADLFFIFAPVGVLTFAVYCWERLGASRYAMAVTSVAAVASLIVFLQGGQTWIEPGVVERGIVYPALAGLLVTVWATRDLAARGRHGAHAIWRHR